MAKIRYALVGFGGIAENRVAKEGFACDRGRFKALPHAQLVGATDLNPAREAAASALGLKWYAGLGDVLADKSIDAVYVATNNLSHVPLAMAAPFCCSPNTTVATGPVTALATSAGTHVMGFLKMLGTCSMDVPSPCETTPDQPLSAKLAAA